MLAEMLIEGSFDEDGPYNRHLAGLQEVPDECFRPGWEESEGFTKQEPNQFLNYGFYFGMAFAILRAEEPFASNGEVVSRARWAAIMAMRSGGDVERMDQVAAELARDRGDLDV